MASHDMTLHIFLQISHLLEDQSYLSVNSIQTLVPTAYYAPYRTSLKHMLNYVKHMLNYV